MGSLSASVYTDILPYSSPLALVFLLEEGRGMLSREEECRRHYSHQSLHVIEYTEAMTTCTLMSQLRLRQDAARAVEYVQTMSSRTFGSTIPSRQGDEATRNSQSTQRAVERRQAISTSKP